VLTLTAISFDRFYVIFYPLKPKLRFKHFVYIMSCIWIVSISISSFNLFSYQKGGSSNESWSNMSMEDAACDLTDTKLFKYCLGIEVFIQFVLPLVMITFCVMAIYYKIYLQKGEYSETLNLSVKRIQNKKKVIF
jgi:hypothetical protein